MTRIPSREQLGGKLQTVATLARAGIIRPQRPDRLLRAGAALARWGATPAAGYTAAAARYPDALGLIDERGSVTFRELHERSNAFAHALARDGVRAGDAVAIMCRNHRGWVDAYVAANKLGAQRAVHEHRLLGAAAC
jgi:fatty-acyl-CoA synthase